jgi:type VI secretion system secreted protein VgrG
VSIALPARDGGDVEVLGPGALEVRSLQLDEEISAAYQLSVLLVTENTLLDVDRLVGAEFELDVTRGRALGLADRPGFDERQIHGIVLSADYLGTHGGFFFVRIGVGPALSLLSLSSRSRIFQDRTVVEIVQAVVADLFVARGRELVVDRLVGDHPLRDYCVQSRETDLAFVERILAEAGIFYVWDHEGDVEKMVLLDANESLPALGHGPATAGDKGPPLVEIVTGDQAILSEGITQLRWSRRVRTAKHEAASWDWKTAPPVRAESSVTAATADPWEIGAAYVHDIERVLESDDGRGPLLDLTMAQAERNAARSGVESAQAEGVGNLIAVTPGATFECSGHPNPHLDRAFMITSVTHRVEIAGADILDGGGDAAPHYVNEFRAIPLEQEFRPYVPAKPRIQGPQLASVVGPPGEEIHTDAHGRVKVWMHWDREGEAQRGNTTCFVRVVQMLAGPGYGTFFLPRVGMEVVVAFLDGDPDQPLVTGCVYNGQQPPPYALPDERTRSTIKTASSPGGVEAGFNELRFEDAKGREQIYVHAQRNLDERVRACHSTTVGVDQTLTVKKDRTKTVEADEHRTIGGSRNTKIGGSAAAFIAGGRFVEVGCAPPEPGAPAGVDETHVVGARYVYADELCYTEVAESSVEMTPDTITLKAKTKLEIQVGNTVLTITPDMIRAATKTAEVIASGSSLKLDESAELASANHTVVKQGSAALQLENQRARLESRAIELEVVTSPNAARIELGDHALIRGKAVALEPTEGDSHLRVEKSRITSRAETCQHEAALLFKILGARIDLN